MWSDPKEFNDLAASSVFCAMLCEIFSIILLCLGSSTPIWFVRDVGDRPSIGEHLDTTGDCLVG